MINPDAIAAALLTGPWTSQPMRLRVAHALDRLTVGVRVEQLVDGVLERWPQPPDLDALIAFLRVWPDDFEPTRVARIAPAPPPLRPHQPVFAPSTRAQLRELLWLTDGELDWFADVQSRGRGTALGPLQHYRYRWLPANGKIRLLEIPKPRLKEIQRRLQQHVVRPLPVHPAAHGSVPGRSVRSCLTAHTGRAILVRCDLEGFFAAVTDARVRGLLTGLGPDAETTRLLAGLLTATVPVSVRSGLPLPTNMALLDSHRRTLRRLALPHLPQGAPTSPGLANAVGYSLDRRLSLLAASFGASYTRYVDDLIFSADRELGVGALLAGVRDIVGDQGFRLAERKTAVLRDSKRQAVLGAVVNSRTAIDRRELDRLKAVLHNCARHGVASQTRGQSVADFRARLAGQLGWVASLDPAKGTPLLAAFQALDWQ